MGRYYDGSISGRWAFGLQCSTTPEKFGAEEIEPYTIEYVIYRNNLKAVTDKISELEEQMGDQKNKIYQFFLVNSGYNDEMLEKAGIDPIYLEAYWDWRFGNKVVKFFENNPDEDECEISSEI